MTPVFNYYTLPIKYFLLLFLLLPALCTAQETICYPLDDNFQAIVTGRTSPFTAKHKADATIAATITLTNGCGLTAYSQIKVQNPPLDPDTTIHQPKFFVPNAFSPNEDGMNDVFRI